jgi:enoyl-CoA hydratase/carnithine racemase
MSWGLVYGDETYRFAITPATLGLPCNAPGLLNFLEPRAPSHRQGDVLHGRARSGATSGQLAERMNIINKLVPETELEARVYALAQTIANAVASGHSFG